MSDHIRIQVARTIPCTILDTILQWIVQNVIQKRVRIVQKDIRVSMLSSKLLAFPLKCIIPPSYHSLIREGFGLDHVRRCPVKWRKVHEEEVLVPSFIQRLHTFTEHGGNDRIVEIRERHFQFACIADIIDSNPDSNQGVSLCDFKMLPEFRLYPGQELLCLIDERDSPVMVEGRASRLKVRVNVRTFRVLRLQNSQLLRDVGPSKCKIPQLRLTTPRVCQSRLETTSSQIFHPIRSTLCSSSKVLDDTIRPQFRGRYGKLVWQVIPNKAEIRVAIGALYERVRVPECNSITMN